MLCINTDKIKISTVGASFTVHFIVAPEEIEYLKALHDKYAEMNMKAFTLTAQIAEHTERGESDEEKNTIRDKSLW